MSFCLFDSGRSPRRRSSLGIAAKKIGSRKHRVRGRPAHRQRVDVAKSRQTYRSGECQPSSGEKMPRNSPRARHGRGGAMLKWPTFQAWKYSKLNLNGKCRVSGAVSAKLAQTRCRNYPNGTNLLIVHVETFHLEHVFSSRNRDLQQKETPRR